MDLYPLVTTPQRTPWNKGRIIGQKAPLKLREIWAIRFRLQQSGRLLELALFNLAIDSKLRGCDLIRLKVTDVAQGGGVMSRATVIQRKTDQPVQFEITEQTRETLDEWISEAQLGSVDFLFPSRRSRSPHISTRLYSRPPRRRSHGDSGGICAQSQILRDQSAWSRPRSFAFSRALGLTEGRNGTSHTSAFTARPGDSA